MILKASQRSGARNLALHLTSNENDHVEVHQVRGFVSDKLLGAFKESEALSKGTRCKQHLFSLSLNPPEGKSVTVDEFEQAIDRAQKKLGLTGQPRAIVFHEKEGRRHAHAVWCRIDRDKMKAIQLPHYKRKLNSLSKQLFKDHNWRLPVGYIDKQLTDPKNFTLDEWQQAKRVKKDPRQIKQVFQQAWKAAQNSIDPAQAFMLYLKEQGYALAQGKRKSHVAVDHKGEIYSVPRQLGLKAKEVRAVLGDASKLRDAERVKSEIDKDDLEKAEQFKKIAMAEAFNQALHFAAKLDALKEKQHRERKAQKEHHTQRQADEARIRQSRFRRGIKGLWDRLNGRHDLTKQENRFDAQISAERDAKEREELIRHHLWERGQLRKERDQSRQKLKLVKERNQASKNLERNWLEKAMNKKEGKLEL